MSMRRRIARERNGMLIGARTSGYNPPQFAIDAAKEALDRVECNQYSPTKVWTWSLGLA